MIMTKEQIIEFAKANGVYEDFICRFQYEEPLSYGDLKWAYEHNLDLGYHVYLRTVKKNGWTLFYVPEEHRNYKLCFAAVNDHGSTLGYVPEEHKTYEICMFAVKKNGAALEYVPEEHRTYEMCMIAVKQFGLVLEHVPKDFRTHEICLEAVKNHGLALKYVPENQLTTLICMEAMKQCHLALDYVPEKYRQRVKQKPKLKNWRDAEYEVSDLDLSSFDDWHTLVPLPKGLTHVEIGFHYSGSCPSLIVPETLKRACALQVVDKYPREEIDQETLDIAQS